MASQPVIPNVYTSLCLVSWNLETSKSRERDRTLARTKKRIHLPASFDVQVEEWQQFIGNIPGIIYDGIDLAEDGEGNVIIVAGYGKMQSGERREYSAETKSDMQAYASSLAGDVIDMNKNVAS